MKEILELRELGTMESSPHNLKNLIEKMRGAPAPVTEDHAHILWIIEDDEACFIEWNRRIDSIHHPVNGEWEFFSITGLKDEVFYPYHHCCKLALLYGAEVGHIEAESLESVDLGKKTKITHIEINNMFYVFYLK